MSDTDTGVRAEVEPKEPGAEVAPAVNPTNKAFWPGNIKVANERGHFSGCAVKMFTRQAVKTVAGVLGGQYLEPDEQLNEWAESQPALMIVYMATAPGSITIVYTKTLSPEEMEEYDELARAWEDAGKSRREKKQAAADAKREAEEKAEQEVRRLVALGKTCEHHHGSLVEENRKLRKGKGKGGTE